MLPVSPRLMSLYPPMDYSLRGRQESHSFLLSGDPRQPSSTVLRQQLPPQAGPTFPKTRSFDEDSSRPSFSLLEQVRRDDEEAAFWRDQQRAARLTQASAARTPDLSFSSSVNPRLLAPPSYYPPSLPTAGGNRLPSALMCETSVLAADRRYHLELMAQPSLLSASSLPSGNISLPHGPSSNLLPLGRMEMPLTSGPLPVDLSMLRFAPPPLGLAYSSATVGEQRRERRESARANDKFEFPKKLMGAMIVHEEEGARSGNPSFVWINGGRGFVVVDKDLFIREVLQRHGLLGGKDAKYSSFVRKTNRWCFQRSTCRMGQYFHHPQFQRGRPELLDNITQAKDKPSKA